MACFFCGNNSCISEPSYDKGYVFYQCDVCGRYVLSEYDIMRGKLRSVDKDVVAGYLYHNIFVNAKNREPAYAALVYFDELPTGILEKHPHFHAVSYKEMEDYNPRGIADRINKILVTLNKKTEYLGQQLELSTSETTSLLFIRRFNQDGSAVENHMIDSQYLQIKNTLKKRDLVKVVPDGRGSVFVTLLPEGQELAESAESDKPSMTSSSATAEMFSTEYLNAHIRTMNEIQDSNPTSAIGMAKELIETCCKTILIRRDVQPDKKWDFNQLVGECMSLLGIKAKEVNIEDPEMEIVKPLLGCLRQAAKSISDLRNAYGGGHGKEADFQPLKPKYAHLAVASSIALSQFLWETHEEKRQL